MPHRALTELLRGSGAHADPIACVEDISADMGGRQVAGFPHSIAQVVFPVNYRMVAHNSYHAGQIALIRRALGVWPPRPGGDRW